MTLKELNELDEEIRKIEREIDVAKYTLDRIARARNNTDGNDLIEAMRLLTCDIDVRILTSERIGVHYLRAEFLRLLPDLYRVTEMQLQAKIRQMQVTMDAKKRQINAYLSNGE
jgi:hypothetical protein